MQPTTQPVDNPLRADRKGEQVVFELKRHPIGMTLLYVSLAVLVLLISITALLAQTIFTDYDGALVRMTSLIIIAVSVFLAIIFAVIARTIYYDNRWVLTTDSLTQIGRTGLFHRQSSQLGLDNLEDVTVLQAGILPHIFNYGVLRCQTAGEYGKFLFSYCPAPNEYAQKLLMAREMLEHGAEHKID